MTDLEKYKQRAERAEAELAAVVTRQQVSEVATRLGFRKPKDAVTLSADRLRYDPETETVVGIAPGETIETVLKSIADECDYLIAEAAAKPIQSSKPTNSATTVDGVDLTQIYGPSAIGAVANKFALERPEDYKRYRQVAIDRGIIKPVLTREDLFNRVKKN